MSRQAILPSLAAVHRTGNLVLRFRRHALPPAA